MITVDFSVIIPAYNEAEYLPNTLNNLHQIMQKISFNGEIIVVDNNSTDKTSEIARSFGTKVVFEQHNQISRARNAGAKSASGNFLLFIDADTSVSLELITSTLSNLIIGQCCGGGALVSMDRELGLCSGFFVKLWNRISVTFNLAAGCYIFARRDAFFDTGGFNEKVYASEEIWLSRNLKRWGKSKNKPFVIIEHPKVLTSARKLDRPWAVYSSLFLSIFFPIFPFYRKLCFAWYKK